MFRLITNSFLQGDDLERSRYWTGNPSYASKRPAVKWSLPSGFFRFKSGAVGERGCEEKEVWPRRPSGKGFEGAAAAPVGRAVIIKRALAFGPRPISLRLQIRYHTYTYGYTRRNKLGRPDFRHRNSAVSSRTVSLI